VSEWLAALATACLSALSVACVAELGFDLRSIELGYRPENLSEENARRVSAPKVRLGC